MSTKRTTIKGKTQLPQPWDPCDTTKPEWHAIKAIYAGDASKEQMHTFLGWMAKATGINELEFRPDSERATTFASGKRFVGQQFFVLAKSSITEK